MDMNSPSPILQGQSGQQTKKRKRVTRACDECMFFCWFFFLVIPKVLKKWHLGFFFFFIFAFFRDSAN